MLTTWIPERIEATGAGDVVVTTKPGIVIYLMSETEGVTVTLKNGSSQVYAGLTGPDEDDHKEAPISFNQGITLNFSAAGAATIKYR